MRLGAHRWLGVLAIHLLPVFAFADDPRAPALRLEDAVWTARAAVPRGDRRTLAALAAAGEPSPWVLLDELLGLGEPVTALGLAGAAPPQLAPRLARAVARLGGGARQTVARRQLATASARTDPRECLDRLGGPIRPDPGSLLEVRWLRQRASALESVGRPDDAVDAWLAAARTAHALEWHEAAGFCARTAGRVACSSGRLATGRDCFEVSLAAAIALDDARRTAEATANLGQVAATQRDWATARPLLEDASRRFRSLGLVVLAWKTTSQLADVLLQVGDVARSYTLQHAAFEALAASDEGKDELADVASRLGELFWTIRDRPQAEQWFTRSVELCRSSGDVWGEAAATGTLALCNHESGRWETARALETQSHRMFTELGDAEAAAIAEQNLAHFDAEAGRHFDALRGFVSCLMTFERLGRPYLRAIAQAGMADCVAALGDPRGATRMYRDVHAIATELEATDLLRIAYSGLAVAANADGNRAQAAEYALEVANLTRRAVEATPSGIERDTDRRVLRALEAGMGAAWVARDAATLQTLLERSRSVRMARALGEVGRATSVGVRTAIREAHGRARADEAEALGRYQDAVSRRSIRSQRQALRTAYQRARRETDEVWNRHEAERLASGSGAIHPPDCTLDQLAAALAPDEAFVYLGTSLRSVFALVVRHGDHAEFVDLGDEPALRRTLDAFRPQRPDADPTARPDAVRAAMIAPLPLDDRIESLTLCGPEELTHLAWASIERDREISIVPSATAWLAARRPPVRPPGGVVAVGDPDYAETVAGAELRRLRGPGFVLARAEGTRAEALAVRRRPSDAVLLGSEATIARLERELEARADRQLELVHFACHGLTDGENPRYSALVLTPTAGDDGLLTAVRVLGMRIPAELVVLSACESGVGTKAGPDGLSGLVRAFTLAGARRVLASLWRVDDASTRDFMTRLHARLRAGERPAQALRSTQRAFRDAGAPSKDWAAWVLWGPGR